jgi:hypothetical protein
MVIGGQKAYYISNNIKLISGVKPLMFGAPQHRAEKFSGP